MRAGGWSILEGSPTNRPSLKKWVFHIPGDSGEKTFFARYIADVLKAFDEAIVWIDEFMVWPSAENWPLFHGFRRSFGETRVLIDAPGHLVTPADSDAVFSLLSMVLYFVWGAIAAPGSGDLLIRISHDEMADIYLNRDLDLGPTLGSALIALANEYAK